MFPGASQQTVSQAWHQPPPPRVKPQTNTTQLSADLKALTGDAGTHGPEAGIHTHIHKQTEHRGTQTQKHTRTNHNPRILSPPQSRWETPSFPKLQMLSTGC